MDAIPFTAEPTAVVYVCKEKVASLLANYEILNIIPYVIRLHRNSKSTLRIFVCPLAIARASEVLP